MKQITPAFLTKRLLDLNLVKKTRSQSKMCEEIEGITEFDIKNLVYKLQNSQNVVFVTGAGISTSAGIPDFRSKGGLFDQVQKQFPELSKGQELFDANLFRQERTTSMFFISMSLLCKKITSAKPTKAHQFMKKLDDKNRILRVYTQNIDGLEAKTWESEAIDKVVLLHGSLQKVYCPRCRSNRKLEPDDVKLFSDGKAPGCNSCEEISNSRNFFGLRETSIGCMRPDVVLYNEHHPLGTEIASRVGKDVNSKPDLLLIMGSSLKVPGCKQLVKDIAKSVRKRRGLVLYLNRTEIAKAEWDDVIDYHILGEIDDCVAQLNKLMFEIDQIPNPKPPREKRKRETVDDWEVTDDGDVLIIERPTKRHKALFKFDRSDANSPKQHQQQQHKSKPVAKDTKPKSAVKVGKNAMSQPSIPGKTTSSKAATGNKTAKRKSQVKKDVASGSSRKPGRPSLNETQLKAATAQPKPSLKDAKLGKKKNADKPSKAGKKASKPQLAKDVTVKQKPIKLDAKAGKKIANPRKKNAKIEVLQLEKPFILL